MGLTVNYELFSTAKSTEEMLRIVQRIRELATQLPFRSVRQIQHCSVAPERRTELQAMSMSQWPQDKLPLLRAGVLVPLPWNRHIEIRAIPEELLSLCIDPVSKHCETLHLRFCRPPKKIKAHYRPKDDLRFCIRDGSRYVFSPQKYAKWSRHHGGSIDGMFSCVEREIEIKDQRWQGYSFCKTEYVARHEGVNAFLRCHLAVVLLLEQISKLPKMKVRINDEGHFGSAYYSDSGDPARYYWHPPTHELEHVLRRMGFYEEFPQRDVSFKGANYRKLPKFLNSLA